MLYRCSFTSQLLENSACYDEAVENTLTYRLSSSTWFAAQQSCEPGAGKFDMAHFGMKGETTLVVAVLGPFMVCWTVSTIQGVETSKVRNL